MRRSAANDEPTPRSTAWPTAFDWFSGLKVQDLEGDDLLPYCEPLPGPLRLR